MIEIFKKANILLPKDSSDSRMTSYAVVACDQHTGEVSYWEQVKEIAGDNPSALNIMLPEVYLSEADERIPLINSTMNEYISSVFEERKDVCIYLRRTQRDGRVREGVVICLDLETYDYHKEAKAFVRATEGTVLSRIPPRVKIRKDAPIEISHVMLLIDNEEKNIIEPLADNVANYTKLYDFPLMLGGGNAAGFLLEGKDADDITNKLNLIGNCVTDTSFTVAVGDGNHSLATAKTIYEDLKEQIGDEAKDHPARYALVEVVNIHSDALDFEPIHRYVKCADLKALIEFANEFAISNSDKDKPSHTAKAVYKKEVFEIPLANNVHSLPVGALQSMLDKFVSVHPDAEVDYIHGEDALLRLSDSGIGIYCEKPDKKDLFRSVALDGVLPRKTFSMGEAHDKRYYIEARRIKK